jgi:hypothetical protein
MDFKRDHNSIQTLHNVQFDFNFIDNYNLDELSREYYITYKQLLIEYLEDLYGHEEYEYVKSYLFDFTDPDDRPVILVKLNNNKIIDYFSNKIYVSELRKKVDNLDDYLYYIFIGRVMFIFYTDEIEKTLIESQVQLS